MFKVFYEDVIIGTKSKLGTTEFTEADIIEFATNYDPQRFHLDDEFAKSTPFGGLCASGWHTCAKVMRVIVDNMQETGFACVGSPGIDKLRWIKPVFPGDVLTIENEIIKKRTSSSRPNIGLVSLSCRAYNQHNELVLEFNNPVMVLRSTATQ